ADEHGERMPEVLASRGVELKHMLRARNELKGVQAYLELHIEQGPVLERLSLPMGVVEGTVGVERHFVSFRGQSLHAGSTPMDARRDSRVAAARFILDARDQALRSGGLATVGRCETRPGIATATAETTTIVLDQRHQDEASLAKMVTLARAK